MICGTHSLRFFLGGGIAKSTPFKQLPITLGPTSLLRAQIGTLLRERVLFAF